MDDSFLTDVMVTLSRNPTVAELDYLLEAYTKVGYLAAEAEGLAEEASSVRKNSEADAYLTAKRSGDKITDKFAEASAVIMTAPSREAEITAATKARKLKNLLNSLEQTINGIKYLGRMAG